MGSQLSTRNLYQRFFDLSSDLCLICDLKGIILSANPAWERVLGYSIQSICGKAFMDFVHPDDKDSTSRVYQLVSSGQNCEFFENRYRTRDGEYRWLRWSSGVEVEQDLIYAVGHDVTEEREVQLEALDANRRAQLALAFEIEARQQAEVQQERQLELLMQIPAIAAVLKGPEHVFEMANPSYCKLVGNRELIGKKVTDALPNLDLKVLGVLDRVYQAGQRFVSKRFPIVADWDASGRPSRRFFDLIYEPLRDASGAVNGIWVIAFDTTETIAMEAKLRTTERMAGLGQMAAGVAHEINNPLGYAIANLELLTERITGSFPSDTDQCREFLNLISKSADGLSRVREIVRGLRTFSRNDDGQNHTVNLLEVIRSALEITSNEIRHRAQIIENYEPVPGVFGNDQRLVQVMINLLMNAAQSIEEGKASENRITISTSTNAAGGAVLCVSDTGCGIEPENLDKIFDPFFTSKPVGEGTGLGLSICHGIITAMKGEIHVTSQVGGGTTFQIDLPAAQKEVPKVSKVACDARPSAVSRRLKILTIDDEKGIRDVISDILQSEHDIVSLESAQEGLALLTLNPEAFDLIFCDVMLPGMTGMEFYERLSELDSGIEKRVVFMTGGAFTPRLAEWISSLSNLCLEKPFPISELRRIVARAAS